jgi:hypothetical protein
VVHIAWWTGKSGEAGVYYARSDDGGSRFTPTGIATGARSSPAHVQLALLRDGRVAVAWDDGQSDIPGILVRVGQGTAFGPSTRISASGVAATFPVLAAPGDSLLVAWSQVGRAAHRAAMATRQDMSAPKTVMPLPRVGQAEIVGRQGR